MEEHGIACIQEWNIGDMNHEGCGLRPEPWFFMPQSNSQLGVDAILIYNENSSCDRLEEKGTLHQQPQCFTYVCVRGEFLGLISTCLNRCIHFLYCAILLNQDLSGVLPDAIRYNDQVDAGSILC